MSQGNFRPDLAPYNNNGTYTTYLWDYGEIYTLLGEGMQNRDKTITKNMLVSLYGEIDILDGLKFKSQINIGLTDTKENQFLTSKHSTVVLYQLYGIPGAQLNILTNNSWSTSFANTLSFNKTFAQSHTIDAVLGVSWDRNRYDAEAQHYRGFPDDDIMVNINSAQYVDDPESESLEQGLNSIFGRINYNYKDKYLATFTARRDGSTKFGPNSRYGFFPSGALAWNLHNESFFKGHDKLNQLKLRASWGLTGSDNLPSFTYLTYYQSLGNGYSSYDGQNGLVVSNIPNSEIRWEETEQLDLGLEFGLFNSRFNGEIAYYSKYTSGMILFVPITFETGSTNWNQNVAEVSNQGWEFTIGGDIIRNDNFTWHSSLNITTVNNKVEHLYNGSLDTTYGETGVVEGEPLGSILGYDVIKIAQTQDEIDDLNSMAPEGTYQSTLTQPGDYIFKDSNGDGTIDANDRVPLGDINPDFFGGWNNTFTYKNWDLSMNWNFSQGQDRNYADIYRLYKINFTYNVTPLVYDTWTPEDTNAPYARLNSPTHGSVSSSSNATSRSVVDASYIKLRSMSIGYRFPESLFKGTGVTNAKLSLIGNNLFTITNYLGLDPENVDGKGFGGRTIYNRNDYGREYPSVRSFSLALNVSL